MTGLFLLRWGSCETFGSSAGARDDWAMAVSSSRTAVRNMISWLAVDDEVREFHAAYEDTFAATIKRQAFFVISPQRVWRNIDHCLALGEPEQVEVS